MHQKTKLFLPVSPETCGMKSLQLSWCLWRILTAESLPLRLKPPVSNTFPGLSKQLAIPQPSTQSAVVVTPTLAGLRDGTMDGTEGTGRGQSCSNGVRPCQRSGTNSVSLTNVQINLKLYKMIFKETHHYVRVLLRVYYVNTVMRKCC